MASSLLKDRKGNIRFTDKSIKSLAHERLKQGEVDFMARVEKDSSFRLITLMYKVGRAQAD